MERFTTEGIVLPALGLGTWRLAGDAGQKAIESALALGYRHIDTAEMYDNEAAVGAAVAASGLPRRDVHLTTKVWWTNLAPAAIRSAIAASLEKLRTDYVDLYLIHWPAPDMDLGASLAAMLRLREEGLTRAIGVANFPFSMLKKAVEEIGAPIACDQVEYHAMLDQSKLIAYARLREIPIIAYCPLAQGRLAANPTLATIAAKHRTSASSVALAWLLGQKGVGAIPKSSRRNGQMANLAASELVLDAEDRAAIAALPKNVRCVNPSFAPHWDN